MSAKEGLDFERALRELEDIVRRLDGEDVSLDEAIALFERGMEHVKAANRWLDEASGRVEELIETATGSLETRPFESPGAEDR